MTPLDVLADFIDVANACGGVERQPVGYYVPHGDPDWIDLGEALVNANLVLRAAGDPRAKLIITEETEQNE